MAVNHQVGETAGAVWNLLDRNGPQTLVQLRKKLNGNGELMNFAVGRLARPRSRLMRPSTGLAIPAFPRRFATPRGGASAFG